jgi:Uma2 family endonuclease
MVFADRPDPELVAGELRERAMTVFIHGWIQGVLMSLFLAVRTPRRLFPASEVCVELRDGEFRVPDVAVFEKVPPPVPSFPPLVTVEILFANERHGDVMSKCEDFRRWGVTHIWLVDPYLNLLHVYTAEGLANVAALELAEYGLRITMADLLDGLPEESSV